MKKIFHKNKLFAIQVKSMRPGSKPITPGQGALQLLTFKHNRGRVVEAHWHQPKQRMTKQLQECLIVSRGRIKVTLYDNEKKMFKNLYLHAGEAIIFLSGGHKVEVKEDAEMYEIKNGPFIDDKIFINS